MPISRDVFRSAQAPVRDRVLAFLKANPGQAFSVMDVFTECEGFAGDPRTALMSLMIERTAHEGRAPTHDAYETALRALVTEGVAAAARYQGTEYFALASETPA